MGEMTNLPELIKTFIEDQKCFLPYYLVIRGKSQTQSGTWGILILGELIHIQQSFQCLSVQGLQKKRLCLSQEGKPSSQIRMPDGFHQYAFLASIA